MHFQNDPVIVELLFPTVVRRHLLNFPTVELVQTGVFVYPVVVELFDVSTKVQLIQRGPWVLVDQSDRDEVVVD